METTELFRRSLIVAFLIHRIPVLVAVRQVNILTNGEEFTEGAILRAGCLLGAGPHPLTAKVSWFMDDHPLAETDLCHDPPIKWRSTTPRSTFCKVVSRRNHGQVLRCTMEDPAFQQPLHATKRISVNYVDLSLDSDSYKVGDKVTATCTVSNSLSAKISWYVGGVFVKDASNVTLSYDTTVQTVTDVYRAYVDTEEDNETAIGCQADTGSFHSLVKTTKILNVKLRSNPVANVTWYFGDDVINTAELEFEAVNNCTFTTGFTKRLTRNDDGKTVRCDVDYERNHSSSYVRIRVASSDELQSTLIYAGSVIIILGIIAVVVLCYAWIQLVPMSWRYCCYSQQRESSASHQKEVNMSSWQGDVMAGRPLPSLPPSPRGSSRCSQQVHPLFYDDSKLRPSGSGYMCRDSDTDYLVPRTSPPVEYLRVMPDPMYHQIPPVPKVL